MISYKLSPFVDFIESHLIANSSQYAVFHRLTGEIVEPATSIRSLLQTLKTGHPISLDREELSQYGPNGLQIRTLIDKKFLVSDGEDPLASFAHYLVVRPLQNPAVSYFDDCGNVWLVRLSMAERIYSPEPGRLPPISEEKIPPLAMDLFLAADGARTLCEIHAALRKQSEPLLEDQEFRATLDFLTKTEMQLVKLTSNADVLTNPFQPANLVPRNFYHSSKWPAGSAAGKSITDFHVEGIEDAVWEFDLIEPTINHALRFPSELLGESDYGSRFCDAVLKQGLFSRTNRSELKVLEVGGGTGTFARSFIDRAQAMVGSLSYQILDLSPALAESQRQLLRDVQPAVTYSAQDATKFDLALQKFDLIIANEVIADFPVAVVERRSDGDNANDLGGDGSVYVAKYRLSLADAPELFYVNAGVFQFLERAWKHLAPGGALILTEYGSESHYPVESSHLNHSEFSIHFGHVTQCAQRIGYECRLENLTEFLSIDDGILVLNGREEHIQCPNHVFEKYGVSLPFALFSEGDFKARFGDLAKRLRMTPIRFLPVRSNFHYGPNVSEFLTLILRKGHASPSR